MIFSPAVCNSRKKKYILNELSINSEKQKKEKPWRTNTVK